MAVRHGWLAVQALLLALVLAPSPLLGAPDDDVKQARKDLKKNLKQLAAISDALVKTDQRLDQILGAPKLDEAAKTKAEADLGELRTKAGEVVAAVARADDATAAEALLQFGSAVADPRVAERTQSELGQLRSDEALGVLAAVLGGDLLEEGGKKKGKKAPQPWQAQVLVARVFDGVQSPLTIPPLAAQIEKGVVPPVVNACVTAGAKKQDKRIVAALIELLGRVQTFGGHEYYRVRQALVDLTGQDYFTKERWLEWWKGVEATYDFSQRGEAREAATRERAKEEKVPTFFGSEIASNRLCFVVDTSGSMEMTDRPQESSETDADFAKKDPLDPAIKALSRMNRAKAQLTACIECLQPTQSFTIIAFAGGSPRLWREAPVPANEASKADALKYVESLHEGGGTNTYDALKAAFNLRADPKNPQSMPAIDTIYLLSDGAPMVKLGNPGEQMRLFAADEVRKILDFVERENRFRGVRIDTFGMDGPGVWHAKWGPRPDTLPTEPEWLSILSNFMRELAARTGGQYKSI